MVDNQEIKPHLKSLEQLDTLLGHLPKRTAVSLIKVIQEITGNTMILRDQIYGLSYLVNEDNAVNLNLLRNEDIAIQNTE